MSYVHELEKKISAPRQQKLSAPRQQSVLVLIQEREIVFQQNPSTEVE